MKVAQIGKSLDMRRIEEAMINQGYQCLKPGVWFKSDLEHDDPKEYEHRLLNPLQELSDFIDSLPDISNSYEEEPF